jgi:hypothetical protein
MVVGGRRRAADRSRRVTTGSGYAFQKLWRGFAQGFAPSFSAHVRFGEHGAPVQLPVGWFWGHGSGSNAVVSHISRKTSEIWGTRLWWPVKDFGL